MIPKTSIQLHKAAKKVKNDTMASIRQTLARAKFLPSIGSQFRLRNLDLVGVANLPVVTLQDRAVDHVSPSEFTVERITLGLDSFNLHFVVRGTEGADEDVDTTSYSEEELAENIGVEDLILVLGSVEEAVRGK